MAAQVVGHPRALPHQAGDAGEFVGVFEQEGEVGGAAADGFDEVGEAEQGVGGARAFGGGFGQAGDKGVEARLALRREAAVAAALGECFQTA